MLIIADMGIWIMKKWILIDDGGGGVVVEMNILKIHCWNNPNMKLNYWRKKLLKTLLTHTDPCY